MPTPWCAKTRPAPVQKGSSNLLPPEGSDRDRRSLAACAGDRRLRLTDDQRRSLAVRGKLLGRKVLGEVAGIVTPDTILRWYRQLVATKYIGDHSSHQGQRGDG